MPTETTSRHDIQLSLAAVSATLLHVQSVTLREELSTPYVAEIEVELMDPEVDPAAWLGQGAGLAHVRQDTGEVLRRCIGVITSVRERAARTSHRLLRVRFEPRLATLRFTQDHRIFQEQTAKDIVDLLFSEHAMSERVEWRLQGSGPVREVCTQYGETTLDFIHRILEEDGIFYFFEHRDEGDVLVLADSTSAYAAASAAELPFSAAAGMMGDQAITAIAAVERLRPAKVTLVDHDFKRPTLDLTATAEATTALGREHYDHPGRYLEPAEGKRRAEALRDGLATASSFVVAKGVACALLPGHTFRLTGAPEEALNQEYVVSSVRSEVRRRDGAIQIENEIRLLPKDAPYRPLQGTPRPRARGPELAIVTGPPGEEIHTDQYGRVKVYFPWDRRSTKDDKSSAWIRVGQIHSSGSVAIPRVGWEVLVDFEDGDPDRPMVLGRLYNGIYSPPYELPAKKTATALKSMSTPGGAGQNEIRMEDGGGAEHISVSAEKDLNLTVANNKTEKITTSAAHGVGANHSLTVGANETLKVGADHSVTVGGSQTWSVGASRTESVGGPEKITVVGSRSTTIGGSHTVMTPMTVSESTPATFSETVGGSCIEVAALGVGMAVAGAASVTVGGAMIEACVTGKSDTTIGAQATTIGGAYIAASGKDAGISVGGARATTVGGAWAASAGSDLNLSASNNLNLTVGGLVAFTAGSVVFKVGGSNVTISAGGVTLKAPSIKLTATGPQPELAPMVEDK